MEKVYFHDAGTEILGKTKLSRARELRPRTGLPLGSDAPRGAIQGLIEIAGEDSE